MVFGFLKKKQDKNKSNVGYIARLAGLLKRKRPDVWTALKVKAKELGVKPTDLLAEYVSSLLENEDPELLEKIRDAMAQQQPQEQQYDPMQYFQYFWEMMKMSLDMVKTMVQTSQNIASEMTKATVLQNIKTMREIAQELTQPVKPPEPPKSPMEEITEALGTLQMLSGLGGKGVKRRGKVGEDKSESSGKAEA